MSRAHSLVVRLQPVTESQLARGASVSRAAGTRVNPRAVATPRAHRGAVGVNGEALVELALVSRGALGTGALVGAGACSALITGVGAGLSKAS